MTILDNLAGEWRVIREFGPRHYIAWCLVRAAYRIKDTNFYQVVRADSGAHVIVEGDAWGSGVVFGSKVAWDDPEKAADLTVRTFDTFDAASDWADEQEVSGG